MPDPITQLVTALRGVLPQPTDDPQAPDELGGYEVRGYVNALPGPIRPDLDALLMVDAPTYTPAVVGGAGYMLSFPVHILVPETNPADVAQAFADALDIILDALAPIPGLTWTQIAPDQFDEAHPSNILTIVAVGGIDTTIN